MVKEELINHCLTFSDSYLDYPFSDNANKDTAILKHKSNKKWFALIGELEGKLIINLKCEPLKGDFYRQIYTGVIPGWHMNKTHWNTIFVNEIPESELLNMIEHSFTLTSAKKKKSKI